MKKLILTVGLPRSGKSTWARTQGYPIVNPDSIRLAMHGEAYVPTLEHLVWTTARIMVDALFLAGHDTVILDACNNTKKRRDEWQSERWELEIAIIRAKKSECLERAGDNFRLINVIERMATQHERVNADEAPNIYYVNMKVTELQEEDTN